MNVYSGYGRRQVGGGIWSTITRGIRPLLERIKPLAKEAGINLAKKAAGHALNVGSKVIQGRDAREAVADEGQILKSEAVNKLRGLKRKCIDEGLKFGQTGKGYKRRKISHCQSKKKKMTRGKVTRKVKSKNSGRKKVYKRARKTKRKQSTRKGRVTKQKIGKRRRSKKVFNDIFGK